MAFEKLEPLCRQTTTEAMTTEAMTTETMTTKAMISSRYGPGL